MEIELYVDDGSNCSERVEWVLNYKGVPYKRINYNTLPRHEFLKMNPLGGVPTLVADGIPTGESMAIVEFIEESFPQRPLLPPSPLDRLKVREICEAVNSSIHPVQASQTARFYSPNISKDDLREYRRNWILQQLTKLRPLLFRSSLFAVGDSFSMADIFLMPIYRKGLSLGLPADALPEFERHTQHCLSHAEVRKSCPWPN